MKTKSSALNPYRYVLVVLVPVILLVSTTFMGLSKFNDDIAFAEREQIGVHELESIYRAITYIQRVRGLSQILHIGDGAIAEELDESRKAVVDSMEASILEPHAVELGIRDDLESVLLKYQVLEQEGDSGSLENFEKMSGLIDELMAMMVLVADRTNLSLDGYHASYYLQEILVKRLSSLSESMARYRGLLSRQAAGYGSEQLNGYIAVARWRWQLELSQMQGQLEQMKQMGHKSIPQNYISQFETVLNEVERRLVLLEHGDGEGASPAAVYTEATRAMSFIQEIFQQTELLLYEIIDARIEKEQTSRTLVLAFGGVALLLTLLAIYALFTNNRAVIADLTHARDQLVDSQKMLGVVLDTIPVSLFWKDRNGVYLGCNKLFANDSGVESPEKIVGLTDKELAWADHAVRYRAEDREVMATKTAKLHVEESQSLGDGRSRWLDVSRVPLHDAEGDVIGVIGTYHDITERKRFEQALLESETRQKSIFNSVVDGLITIDEKGVVQDFNPAAEKIFGYAAEEVVGNKINMLMPDDYSRHHDDYMNNYHVSGHAKVIGIGREVQGLRKDGSVFPLDLAVNELWINGKRLYSGIVRDITERKRVEKMKNEFVSTVSHELRTPLTSIRGSLGLVLGGAVGELPASATEMLRIASNNTERLLLLINDILDMQKIESGMMAFHFGSVDLESLLNEGIQAHASFAEQHEVKLALTRTLAGARVFGDRDRLMQVFANLVSNAAKFSPQGESVEVSMARHRGAIRVSVTDHGNGIPEEFQSKLFEKFTQFDASDTRQKGGTGLGLSISKIIVEKHGGVIGFVSREGAGTTFYFELPELLAEIDPNEEFVPRTLPEKHSACVLIVEDDPDVAVLIQKMMVQAGYVADIAYNVVEARRMLASGHKYYKLLTLDILMPGEDGISFLKSLRRDQHTKDLPVVVVSVKADEARREFNGGAMGVLDWLSKPIDRDRLVNVVKGVSKDQERLPRVLHVEDEADIHKVVNGMLRGHCNLVWTTTLTASAEELSKGDFDLVLLDIGLPDGSGLDLLDTIRKYVKPPRVVIFSAQDVDEEYADQVNAVLVKSKTSNQELYDVLTGVMIEGLEEKDGNES